jgi:WD40 repeat protein
VSFSPDGKRIVTGSFDQTARVWDAATGHETLTLKGHTGPVYSVSFSPDGKRILTGGDDQTAKVWDAATGHVTFTLKGHTAPVLSVSFSPDGTRILTGSDDHTAKVWAGSRALAAKRTAVGAGPRSKARCGGEFSARREEARALLRAETRAER